MCIQQTQVKIDERHVLMREHLFEVAAAVKGGGVRLWAVGLGGGGSLLVFPISRFSPLVHIFWP